MSNSITAFLETLTAASGDYNAAKVGKLALLNHVYKDVRPEVARAGKTITIPLPDIGAFTDLQANDYTPEDINPSSVTIVFNQRPGKAILIRDFEQWRTSSNIAEMFLDPMYKRGQEYINGQLAAQFTNANFSTYSPVVGSTNGLVSVDDAAAAWILLAGGKVPLDDPGDLTLVTHSAVHGAMMKNSAWTQESLVGAMIAQAARKSADLGVNFNFQKVWDTQMNAKTNALTGTVAGTSGAATVTGTSTLFLTEVEVGDRLTFSNAATTVYTVLSIASNTSLTLASNLATSPSGATATQAGYTCAAFHRYAIALALRPLELVNQGNIQSRFLSLNGIPFRVMVSYQHMSAGWLMTIDVGCAVKVIRPDFGVLIKV